MQIGYYKKSINLIFYRIDFTYGRIIKWDVLIKKESSEKKSIIILQFTGKI